MPLMPALDRPPSAHSDDVPLFRRGAWYRALDGVPLPGPGGGSLSIAPALLLRDDLRWAATQGIAMPAPEARASMARRAVTLFRSGVVAVADGIEQSAEEFERRLDERCGVPPSLTRRWGSMLQRYADELEARALGATSVLPRGGVVPVSLPANTFTCLEACLDVAVAGSMPWVRPSRREPFSAHRFVASLLQAGWPAQGIGLYATEHRALLQLLPKVERAIVYGGPSVAAELASAPHVDVRGPGRAIAIVDRECPIEIAEPRLLELVVSDAGRFCSNVGTVVHSDPSGRLVYALAARMDRLSVDHDEAFPLAHWVDTAQARAMEAYLHRQMRAGDRRLTERPVVEVSGGRTWLTPTLIELGDPTEHPLLGLELPFPVAVTTSLDAPAIERLVADARFVHRIDHASTPSTAPPPAGGR